MKIKLLKKVRQRYQILFFPKYFKYYDTCYTGDCMVLIDKRNSWRTMIIQLKQSDTTKEQATQELLKRLKGWIHIDYASKKKSSVGENIWYK